MRIFKDNSFRILLVIFVLFLALPLLFTEPSSTPVGKGASYKEGELMSSSSALPVSSNPFKAMLDGYFDKFSKFYKLPFAANTVKNQMGTSAILFNTEEDARAFVNAQTGRGGEISAVGGGGGEEGPLPARQMREVGRVYLDGTDYFPVMSDGSSYMVYTPQGMVPYDLFASDYVPQEDIEKARAMAPGLSDDEIALALKTIGLNEYLSAVARDGHENTYNRLTKMLDINPQAFGYGYAAPDGRGAFGGPSFGGGGSYAMGGSGSFGGGSGGSGAIIIGGGDTDMAGDLAQKYSSASSGFKGVGRVYDPKVLAQGAGKDGKQDDGKDVFAQFGRTRIAGSENGILVMKKEGYVFEPKEVSQLVKPKDEIIREELAVALGLKKKGDTSGTTTPVILPNALLGYLSSEDKKFGPALSIYKKNLSESNPASWEKSDKIYATTGDNIKKELEDLQDIPAVVIIDGNESGNIIAVGKETFYTAVTDGLMSGSSPVVDQIVTPIEANAGERKITVDRVDTKKLDSLKQSAIIVVSTKEEKEILEKDGYAYVVEWQNYGVIPPKLNSFYKDFSSAVSKMAKKQRERREKEQKLLKETKGNLQKGPK